MTDGPQYDLIFAGGGAAACVTAGRLAKADPSLKILIIEAGGHTLNDEVHIQPARSFHNFLTGGPTNTIYQHAGKPSEALGGRAPVVQTGKALGGGTSINFMMYTRGSASDYDDWEKWGNPGWGSKEMIPLSMKLETYDKPNAHNHGYSGPLKITSLGYKSNVSKQFLETAAKYDKSRGSAEDSNDFDTADKYTIWNMYIDPVTGRRSDPAHGYIYCQSDNKNLKVVVKHRVVRVLFDGDKAIGVEYVDAAKRDTVLRAYASKLVVVAAGAFGSPAILERSGIGKKEVLEKLGIKQKVELPVGENYQDHNLVAPAYIASEDSDCWDPIFTGKWDIAKVHVDEWVAKGTGFMANNGIHAGIKFRPSAAELATLGPAFGSVWKSVFANAPDKGVFWTGILAAQLGPANPERVEKYFTHAYILYYPASIGYIHIDDASDPFKPQDFVPGFMDEEADVVAMRFAYKKARELARRMPFYRGCHYMMHPPFTAGSKAAIDPKGEPGPVSVDAPDIEYTAEDDQMIDAFHRAALGTSWHSMATCSMKPKEKGGVVDPKLNVYGTKNLKVCDLSIAPSNVGANTANTAMMIGEKSALIIAEELGIKGV